MTPIELLRTTVSHDRDRMIRGHEVRILKSPKAFTRNAYHGERFNIQTMIASKAGVRPTSAPHKVEVYATGSKKLSVSNVMVSCDCPDFTYRCEWALHQIGAAEIIYGNGEPPDATNPRANPVLCKHCVRALAYVVNNKL